MGVMVAGDMRVLTYLSTTPWAPLHMRVPEKNIQKAIPLTLVGTMLHIDHLELDVGTSFSVPIYTRSKRSAGANVA